MISQTVSLLILSALVTLTQSSSRLQPDAPIECGACDGWNEPRDAFKIFGNTYYVGAAGVSSVLITSDDGHILVDGALPQSVPLIDASIRSLGFETEDIKLIVNGHAHFDHAGGLGALQRFTGARVVTRSPAVESLTQGEYSPDDPQAGYGDSFPPIANVEGVADGAVLRVGELAIAAHATPGHTPGGTTWSWRSCEDGRCLDIVYADSVSAVSAPGFRFTGDSTRPSIVDSFRRSITTLSELPCDIMIGAHPFVGDLDAKRERQEQDPDGPNPFIDPGACRALADDAMRSLDARIAEETGQ